jgi:TrmH family RNA methyltransferase
VVASPDLLTIRSARIKQARRLATRAFRRKSGQFLVEGPQAVREALGRLGAVQEIYAELGVEDRHPDIRSLARSAGVAWHHADVHALALLTDTVKIGRAHV